MSVTAMLCWYDEPPELLRDAVRGAALICDRLVAADGAYQLTPDGLAESPRGQATAIAAEAFEQGMSVRFLEPRLWPGQVAKRDAVLQEAKKNSDWVMVLDADWRIVGDGRRILAELRHLYGEGVEQVQVRFVQPSNPYRSTREAAPNMWHEGEADQRRFFPLIYRVMPEMHYRREHWSLFCTNDAGEKVGLWGAERQDGHGLARTATLEAEHLFEHRCLFREDKQIVRNRDYIEARDLQVAAVGYET